MGLLTSYKLVRPECRYGHGHLLEVMGHFSPHKWSLMASDGSGFAFTGSVFLCQVCGYTEFFDDKIMDFAKSLEEKAG